MQNNFYQFFANSRKSRQNEKSEYEERIKTKHATFTKIKENYDLKKTLRERIKERAKIEATLKLLNQQKLVLEYTDIHKKIKAGDREKSKLDEELGKAVQKKEEYEVNVVRFERQIKELERLKKINHRCSLRNQRTKERRRKTVTAALGHLKTPFSLTLINLARSVRWRTKLCSTGLPK